MRDTPHGSDCRPQAPRLPPLPAPTDISQHTKGEVGRRGKLRRGKGRLDARGPKGGTARGDWGRKGCKQTLHVACASPAASCRTQRRPAQADEREMHSTITMGADLLL